MQGYLVWQVFDGQSDWFRLQGENYIPFQPDPQGIIRSQVFPGLWLDITALLNGNMPQVLAVLQQGIQSDEHQQFVQRLAQVV